ncbi:MAG: ABC transporter permease [Microthrixaceae bacterium]
MSWLRRPGTLPTNVSVLDGEDFRTEATASTQEFVSFLRPVLLGFAFLALFVAGFVIYNTFTVVVTQRSRELALVRSIGGTPGQVRRSLLGEGLLLGLGASVIGLGIGMALSALLQWILQRFDVGLPGAGFALSGWTVLITVGSGTLITVVSVLIPAFKAGRTRPVEAMRESAVDHSGTSMLRLCGWGTPGDRRRCAVVQPLRAGLPPAARVRGADAVLGVVVGARSWRGSSAAPCARSCHGT